MIKNIKKKLSELEEKVNNLKIQKFVLGNIADESIKGTNPILNKLLYDVDLQQEISYLEDWIEFYSEDIKKYEAKLKRLTQKTEKDIEGSLKLVFKDVEEKPIKNILRIPNIKSVRYIIPFVILLLIITSSLFLLKPSITGHVVLGKETTFNESLRLSINESGTYEWKPKNIGDINSIKATGSIIGNGSVKIYIEKDGRRYLIYKNK